MQQTNQICVPQLSIKEFESKNGPRSKEDFPPKSELPIFLCTVERVSNNDRGGIEVKVRVILKDEDTLHAYLTIHNADAR
jgi:hypothetical protein